jgi:hypothetical protein
MMAKQDRRSFLAKAPAAALAVGVATTAAAQDKATAKPAAAAAAPAETPVKKVHWSGGKRPSSAAPSPTATSFSSPASAPTSRATSSRTPITC